MSIYIFILLKNKSNSKNTVQKAIFKIRFLPKNCNEMTTSRHEMRAVIFKKTLDFKLLVVYTICSILFFGGK